MKFINKDVANNYFLYQKSRLKQLYRLRVGLFLWLIFTLYLIYQFYFGLENVKIGIYTNAYNSTERIFYELPILWLVILLIKFVLFYAEKIPFLSAWQDRAERKEMDRLKSNYEYQIKQKNETATNSNY